jgi:hypothetical protein
MTRTVRVRAHMVPASTCRILPAHLGDDAGVVGAAALAALELAKLQRSAAVAPERPAASDLPGEAGSPEGIAA